MTTGAEDGSPRPEESSRSLLRKSIPSPSGIRRSRIRTSGAARSNSARAFFRLSAVLTSNPSPVRASSARTRKTASSSTTRMLAFTDPPENVRLSYPRSDRPARRRPSGRRRGPAPARSRGQRQRQDERRARAPVLQRQVSAVGARDVARQGQADADAARLPGDERLEQTRPDHGRPPRPAGPNAHP